METKVNMSKPTRGVTGISFLCLPTAVPGVRLSSPVIMSTALVISMYLLTTYRVDSLLWVRVLFEYCHLADTQHVLE